MNYKLQLEDIAPLLPTPEGKHFITGMAHGTMSVELYKPDEIYVILRGAGTFFINGERMNFKENDVLFVPAGIKHRFENFTDDFMTWVVFYGVKGGEK